MNDAIYVSTANTRKSMTGFISYFVMTAYIIYNIYQVILPVQSRSWYYIDLCHDRDQNLTPVVVQPCFVNKNICSCQMASIVIDHKTQSETFSSNYFMILVSRFYLFWYAWLLSWFGRCSMKRGSLYWSYCERSRVYVYVYGSIYGMAPKKTEWYIIREIAPVVPLGMSRVASAVNR